ncbi:MAG: trehalose-phosphatase [Mycobacterium sp.]
MATEVLRSTQLSTASSLANPIKRLVTHARSTGMFFDFDGVLSPIQDDPETAQPLPGVQVLLQSLVQCVSTVAVLSSRPAEFLFERFADVDGLKVFGLYGLEEIGPTGEVVLVKDAEVWLDTIRAVLEAAKDRFRLTNGIFVENKRLSVGLHYRAAPHLEIEVEKWARFASSTWGVQIQQGRLAVELKPQLPVDKGSTLAQHAKSLSTTWYFGDDLGDLPAMSYIQKRRKWDASFSGLNVGVGNDTIVEDVYRMSDVFVDSPQTLQDLLDAILRELAEKR